jgi:hypothetical protein
MSSSMNLSTSAPDTVECLSGYRMKSLNSFLRHVKLIVQVPLTLIIVPLGLVGNCLSFVVIGRERPFSSTSIFLQALAVADTMVLVGYFFRYTPRRIHEFVLLLNWYMEFFNITYGYVVTFSKIGKTASIFITVCVAVERFIAVCKPLKAASICTKRNTYVAVVSVFICSFVYRFPFIFKYTVNYRYDPCVGRTRPLYAHSELYYNPFFEIIYDTVLSISVNTLIPILIFVVITYSVLGALSPSRTNDMSRYVGQKIKESNSATIRVLAVVIVFTILETPEVVYTLVLIVRDFSSLYLNDNVRRPLQYISRFMSVLNRFVNFFIYCAIGRRFRKGLVEVFRRSPVS